MNPKAKAQLQRDKIQEEKAVKLQKIKIKEEQVKDLQVCKLIVDFHNLV